MLMFMHMFICVISTICVEEKQLVLETKVNEPRAKTIKTNNNNNNHHNIMAHFP